MLSQIKFHFVLEANLSRTDSLTGLPNVRGFTEHAEKNFVLAERHHRKIALAYIDVNDFKKVNDELGHGEGNKVLRVIGNNILGSLRASDVAGRLGGDEFVILFPETDEAGARTVCDTLNKNFMLEIQKHTWPISLSIGVACFDSPRLSLDEAIKIADSLMYQVKRSGKNNILFQHYPAS